MLSRPSTLLSPAVAGWLALTLFAPSGRAEIAGTGGVTELLSLDSTGQQATSSCSEPAVSEDARFVAFETHSALLPDDTNFQKDIYVLDRQTGDLVCASTNQTGVFGNQISRNPFISADGRWVVFDTLSDNLQSLDNNSQWDIFRKDLATGELVRVSNAHLSPLAGGSASEHPSISDDGRYVAFESHSNDLIPNDTNGEADVFVRDMLTGLTERVSDGVWGQSNGEAGRAMISGDGLHVAFESDASNLVLIDNNSAYDVFVKQIGFNPTLVSRTPGGSSGNDNSFDPTISSDGMRVAFSTIATNLSATDTNGLADVYVYDVPTQTNVRASVTSAGNQVNSYSQGASIARDGQSVVFQSGGAIAPLDSPGTDVFVHDLQTGSSWTASLPSGTSQAANDNSLAGALALGGSGVVFSSEATNLVPGDMNAQHDVFLRTMHPDPFTYCSAPTTVQGCVPQLTHTGYSSVSNADFFTLIGDDLPNHRSGLLFYGFEGQASNPWGGSTMCVAGIKRRTPLMTTGGLPLPANDCTGFFTFEMNDYAAGLIGGNPRPELSVVGQVVNAQFWGRQGPSGTYLTTALQYVVGP